MTGVPNLGYETILAGLQIPNTAWGAGEFTFSIARTGSTWPGYFPGREPYVGYSTPTGAEADAFRQAVGAWDRLIAPNFIETDDVSAPGSIRLAFTGYQPPGDNTNLAGYAFQPPTVGGPAGPANGDVWLTALFRTVAPTPGGAAFETLLHELGHALGLKHPFEEGAVLPSSYENTRYTVMSYSSGTAYLQVKYELTPTGVRAFTEVVSPSTPMVLDIAAIQNRYGADLTTATGNDVYRFTPDAPFLQTIYDAGGVDTIDLTAFARGSDVDLSPGAYSSIGIYSAADQLAVMTQAVPWANVFFTNFFNNSVGSRAYTWTDNLGIAFTTVIENVVGGSGNDTITGNAAANGLYGGAGADYIRGLDGDDVVEGGDGDDDINGNKGSDIVRGGRGADFVRGGQDNDTVYGDDGDDPHVNGNIGDDVVYGGAGDDKVYGGQNNDTLYGDDGEDTLSGDLGNDLLYGGAGADTFVINPGGGIDRIADYTPGQDRIFYGGGGTYSLAAVDGGVAVVLSDGTQLIVTGVAASQVWVFPA